MGLFDSKWVVEYEYCNSLISPYKKETMIVEASSEYSAKDKAKSILKASYKYVHILSAKKSDGNGESKSSTPKMTYESSNPSREPETVHRYTDEERERRKLLLALEEEEKLKQEKQRQIDNKKSEINKIKKSNIRIGVLFSILSLVMFFFGWIPCWISSAKASASKQQLNYWVELGHSETDSYGQELTSDIAKYSKEASSRIWIPFVILGVCLVITVVMIIVSKKKIPGKLEKASQELKDLEK